MNSALIKLRRLFDIHKNFVHTHNYNIHGAKGLKVNLVGGRHTTFMVLECKCGERVAFPHDNLKLALNYGTEETLKLLANLGFER